MRASTPFTLWLSERLDSRRKRNMFTKILLILVLLFLSNTTFAGDTERYLLVNYRALIDESVYTHSGRSVGDILNQIELLKNPNESMPEIFKEYLLANGVSEEEIEDALASGEFDEILNKISSDMTSMDESHKALVAADIEPKFEPLGFVLNDVLESEYSELYRPEMFELGPLFQAGSQEPAWADLVRTRHIVFYYDGMGFARVFVPGSESESAYNDYQTVLNLILSSLRSNEINVDVYAYSNDVLETTYKLDTRVFSINWNKGKNEKGNRLKPIDLASLNAFFESGVTLEGASVKDNTLVLYGSKTNRAPTLEGRPISLSDLAVAYRAAAYAGKGETYMSLDASSDPARVNVNFGGRLDDTLLGWVAYRSDVVLKILGDGYSSYTPEYLAPGIKESIIDFKTQRERFFEDEEASTIVSEETRFWFYPDDFGIRYSDTDKAVLFGNARFTASAERTGGEDKAGELSGETPPWTLDTLNHFNKNYDRFSAFFDEIYELDHAARLLALGYWLHEGKLSGLHNLDLDSLLQVELPAADTPVDREQLALRYHVNYSTKPTTYKAALADPNIVADESFSASLLAAYNTEAEIEELGIDLEEYQQQWETYSVISGGLDLSPKTAFSVSKPVSGGESQTLRNLKNIRNGETIKVGSEEWLSSGSIPPIPPKPPSTKGFTSDPLGSKKNLVGWNEEKRKISYSNGSDRTVVSITNKESGESLKIEQGNHWLYSDYFHSIYRNEKGEGAKFSFSEHRYEANYKFNKTNDGFIAELLPRRMLSESEYSLIADNIQTGQNFADYWRGIDTQANLLALDKSPDGKIVVISAIESGLEARIFTNGKVTEKYTDIAAVLDSANEISRSKVKRYSVPGKAEMLHASMNLSAEKYSLQLGKRSEAIEIDLIDWKYWMAGGDTPSILKEVMDNAAKKGTEVIIIRDAFSARPVKFGNQVGILSPDPVELAARLNSSFPNNKISLDDPSDAVPNKVLAEAVFSRPDNIGLAIPPQIANVDDRDLLPSISAILKQSGVTEIRSPDDLTKVSDVLVLTAHNDRQLFDYIQSLGDHKIQGKSALAGKYLMLQTCFEAGNTNMVSQLIEKYDLAGVYINTEVVNGVALRRVMAEFSELIEGQSSSLEKFTMRELFERSVDNVSNDQSLPRRVRPEIEKLKRGVMQWCSLPEKNLQDTLLLSSL